MEKLVGDYSSAKHCEVCDTVVPAHALISQKDKGFLHCSSHRCINVVKQKDSLCPEQYAHHLELQRRSVRHIHELGSRRIQNEQSVDAQEKREYDLIKNRVLESTPGLTENNLAVLSIPSGPLEKTTVPHERIAAYTENLKRVIEKANCSSANKEIPQHAEALIHDTSSSKAQYSTEYLCAICKGGCCTLGADTAYISAGTIQQTILKHPALTSDEILETYLSYVPSNSVSNSCINHTDSGCALPREWRSNTCNRFLCPEIKKFDEKLQQSGTPTSVVIIQRDYTHWNRYALDIEFKVTVIKKYTGDFVETDSISTSVLNQ